MNPEAMALADTVLYEGYALYPYRRSSGKNRVRWQFGVLAPRAWVDSGGPVSDGVAGSTESWWQQTECLLEAPGSATVRVRVRFLQTQAKAVEEALSDGTFRPVERLDLGDRTEVPFDEAVSREVEVAARLDDLLAAELVHPFGAPAVRRAEPVRDGRGRQTGRLVRTSYRLSGTLRMAAEQVAAPFPLLRLRIGIENADFDTPAHLGRDEALRRALLATHCLVATDNGSFLSALDPPEWAAPAAAGCRNVRTFPVLAGRPGSSDQVLCAPIILYDGVTVAAESPGDLHDAAEIDEILSLRTLTLTEEEKREARGTDPRVAALLDRVEGMPPEVMAKLHGAIRSLQPGQPGPASTDAVLVEGVRVRRGSRVRLDPRRRGTDAHDMFLAGRTARVEAVLRDVDGSQHVAVTIEDDPSAELHQWYGRFHYYRPDEIHPVGPTAIPAESEASPR
jgi:hypothetical protein